MGISEAEFEIMRGRVEANRCGVDRMEVAKPARKHKYGVAPKEERIVDGILFDSKAEATAYQELLVAKSVGQIIGEIERQPRFPFPMGFAYVADFGVTWKDTGREVIDVKGVETAIFKLKAKCMKYFYPDVKLTLWKGSR